MHPVYFGRRRFKGKNVLIMQICQYACQDIFWSENVWASELTHFSKVTIKCEILNSYSSITQSEVPDLNE